MFGGSSLIYVHRQVSFNAVELHNDKCILHSFTCSVFLFFFFLIEHNIVLTYLLVYYDNVLGHVTFDHLEV